jgi:isopenicillin N synthase-like dioxygenase
MFQACQSQGFFYLDLSDCEAGEVILQGADQIAQLAEKTFKLPEEEKLKCAYVAGDLFGYALPPSQNVRVG